MLDDLSISECLKNQAPISALRSKFNVPLEFDIPDLLSTLDFVSSELCIVLPLFTSSLIPELCLVSLPDFIIATHTAGDLVLFSCIDLTSQVCYSNTNA